MNLKENGNFTLSNLLNRKVLGKETFEIYTIADGFLYKSTSVIFKVQSVPHHSEITFDQNWRIVSAVILSQMLRLEYAFQEKYSIVSIIEQMKTTSFRVPVFKDDAFLYFKGCIGIPFLWGRNPENLGYSNLLQGVPEGALSTSFDSKFKAYAKLSLINDEDEMYLQFDDQGRLQKCRTKNLNLLIEGFIS